MTDSWNHPGGRNMRAELEPLFNPRSVAIIGASATPFKQGNASLKYLLQGGFAGAVYPVNPSVGEIEGLRSYPNIEAIDGHVDCALFVIPAAATLEIMRACARKGVKAAIIGSNGFAELGTPEGFARQEELTRIARAANIKVLGPNTNGIWNASGKFSLGYNTSHGDPMIAGGVSIAAHSGALFNSIAPSLRRFGAALSKFVPVGNEADLDMLDFLEYFIADPDTRVIGLIVEALRNGERFKALAQRAQEHGKPIVALKLGRSAAGAGAALAHSSRLAGNARAYEALFRDCCVPQVKSIEALAGACALLSTGIPRISAATRGLVCVSTSGGGGGLLADHAADFGISLAGNPDGSWTGRAAGAIETFTDAGKIFNPVDGGNLGGWPRLETLFEAMEADGFTGPALFFAHMLPQARSDLAVCSMLTRRKERTGAPVVCVAPGGLRTEVADAYAQAGIPVFSDLASCFTALRCLYDAMENDDRISSAVQSDSAADPNLLKALEKLSASKTDVLDELTSASILAAAGIHIVDSYTVASAKDALTQAQATGWPVVLKAIVPGIAHKNDAGLVAVRIRNEDELNKAFRSLSEKLATYPESAQGHIILQPMLASDAELIIGLSLEEPLGHFTVVGLGGVLAEALDEAVLFSLPLRQDSVRDAVNKSRLGTLLGKLSQMRGIDFTESLLKNIEGLQRVSTATGGQIVSAEVNPLLVTAQGCIGVDALIIKRS